MGKRGDQSYGPQEKRCTHSAAVSRGGAGKGWAVTEEYSSYGSPIEQRQRVMNLISPAAAL
jgi:hypothetical protein